MLCADSKGPTQVTTGNLCFAKVGVVGWWGGRQTERLRQAEAECSFWKGEKRWAEEGRGGLRKGFSF